MSIREEKVREHLRHLAAEFLQHEAGPSSLITVTNATFNEHNNLSTIFFTTLPADRERAALEFAKRKRREFRDYVKSKTRIRALPFFDFAIDTGEKNRQRIDEIGSLDSELRGDEQV